MANALAVANRVPATTPVQGGPAAEETAWKNCWNWSVPLDPVRTRVKPDSLCFPLRLQQELARRGVRKLSVGYQGRKGWYRVGESRIQFRLPCFLIFLFIWSYFHLNDNDYPISTSSSCHRPCFSTTYCSTYESISSYPHIATTTFN